MARERPIVLGIVGDSAAGKTTLARGLVKLLGPDRVTHVSTDDYHKYDRAERSRIGLTPLHPACNHIDILELHLERLHYGQAILKPVYDHATGTLAPPAYVQPGDFVIVEGLLGFHTAVMRQFYDVKVYLDPPEPLRRVWKIQRDTSKRGYALEEVLAELDRREPDSSSFIRPQREHADVVVRFFPIDDAASDASAAGGSWTDTPAFADAGAHLNVRLLLRRTIPHPDLSYLFNGDEAAASRVRLRPTTTAGEGADRGCDVLEIDGGVEPDQATRLEEAIWRQMPDLRAVPAAEFGAYQDRGELRHSDPLALTQLLLVYHVLREQRGLAQRRYARPVAALSRLHLPTEAS